VNGGVSTPGSSNLVDFNQSGTGDYGDFTGTCDIQNYAGCTGHTPETFAGSIESSMLQSIGYDLAAPSPAPGAGAWSLVALLLAGAARRLRGA
jgi:hypothetical protein